MSLKDLIVINRSYRKFDASYKIEEQVLRELIDLARLSPNSANRQSLKFLISNDHEKNSLIFPTLTWAGYLKYWKGPREHERPGAYIIILNDTSIHATCSCDHGIAAQSILLGAVDKGLGGCMIGSIQKDALRETLSLPAQYEIMLVIALGKPIEEIRLEQIKDNNIQYWRDKKGIHHVPKRSLDDLILQL